MPDSDARRLRDARPADARPAAEPRYDVTVDWDVRIPARDGVELSANIWRPVAGAGGGPHGAVPGDPRDDPVRQGQLAAGGRHDPGRVVRGPWLRAVSCRRAWHRLVGRRRAGRIHRRRDPRRVRRGRVARGAAVVRRRGRDVGDQLRRVHRDPGRGASAAAPARDRAGHGDRRPVSRRRPLPRRVRHGQRAVAVRRQPGRDERDAARSRRSGARPWRDEWLARLEATPPWLFAWLRHQTDGPYWRQGSLAPDYDAIEAAIFNIGGWNDSYVDPAFRMQARCPAPSHTLVGNWVHSWPHDAAPGPNLDELHEIERFLDRHLRGVRQRLGCRAPDRLVRTGFRAAGPVPGRRGRVAGGLPRRTRIRRPRSVPWCSPRAARASSSGGLEPAGREDGVGHRHLPASPDDRHARRALVGRRRRAERPRPRPARRRGCRPDLYLRAAARGARDPRGTRGRGAPRGRCARRDTDGAPRGCRSRRVGGAGERGRAEPDPSCDPTRTRSRSSPVSSKRSACHSGRPAIDGSAGHRIRVALASSLWPVPVAVAVSRPRSGSIAGRPRPRASTCRSIPPAGGPGDVAVPAFRTDPPDLHWPTPTALDGGGPAVADPPVWRIDEDVIAGR